MGPVQILGKGMNTKMWEAIVAHAQKCILDKKLHLYFAQKKGVIFNIVGQVMGLVSEGCYIPIDKLSEAEKACFYYHANCLHYSFSLSWSFPSHY